MWLLSLLPDVVWHILTIAGLLAMVAAFVLKRIPFVSQYNLPLKLIGTAVFLIGFWMEGGMANEAKWQARVKDLEAKIAVAEEKSKDTNVKIQTKIVERVKVVKENTVVYRDRIKEVEKLIDKECKVAPEAIDIHNAAAKNVKPGDSK